MLAFPSVCVLPYVCVSLPFVDTLFIFGLMCLGACARVSAKEMIRGSEQYICFFSQVHVWHFGVVTTNFGVYLFESLHHVSVYNVNLYSFLLGDIPGVHMLLKGKKTETAVRQPKTEHPGSSLGRRASNPRNPLHRAICCLTHLQHGPPNHW